jgi:hypothetical protein
LSTCVTSFGEIIHLPSDIRVVTQTSLFLLPLFPISHGLVKYKFKYEFREIDIIQFVNLPTIDERKFLREYNKVVRIE